MHGDRVICMGTMFCHCARSHVLVSVMWVARENKRNKMGSPLETAATFPPKPGFLNKVKFVDEWDLVENIPSNILA